jgi:putative phosphoesterase
MSTHRVALISDIHGNEIALRAVLADIQRIGADRIACLGDVATLGPRPRQVLQLLREHCSLFILGNHDEYMFAPELIEEHTREPSVVGAVHWCRAELDVEDVSFMQRFDRRLQLPLGAAGDLLMFHGSPASNNYDLLVTTPDAELHEQLGQHRAAVMVGGHTHVQMLRRYHQTLVVNPGSVGMPFERYLAGGPPTIMSVAEYCIVEAAGRDLSVSLHRVALEPTALLEAARAWDAPLADYLVAEYQRLAR